MKKNYTPWQSWSPPAPNYFGFPTRDYCPVSQVARENSKPESYKQKLPISGWCSWYHFGKNINEINLEDQARAIKIKAPDLKYFLIDDGWCKWGDWMTPDENKFSNFPAFIKKLRQSGFEPGIWMAPFLIDPNSTVATKHPNWLIRNHHNHQVNGLKVFPFDDYLPWKKYILDFSIPEVKQYIYSCLDYLVVNLGVSLIKLDFLYASYFKPGLINDLVPHKHLVDLFQYIKTKYPQVYTVACGCPYKPARYLVDAIRISKDISWPQLNHLPILRGMLSKLRFSLLRENNQLLVSQQEFFHPDPDVYLKDLPRQYYQDNFKDIFLSGDSYL